MANIRFAASSNLWTLPAGTLVASTAALALPAAATQNSDRSYVWRSLNVAANQTLVRDLGSALAATFIGLANIKLQGGGSVKLYEGGSAASAGVWTLIATLPSQDVDRRIAYAFFSSVVARHWKLEWVNGVGGTADTAEAGYVVLGTHVEPLKNALGPVGSDDVDPSVGRASVDGQQTFARRTPYSTGQFSFFMPAADLELFRALHRAVGRHTPIFAVFNTTISWQAWLLRLTTPLDITLDNDAAGYYRVAFGWEEVR